MSQVPQWKIYNPQGEYVAACKYLEDAAALVAVLGDGTTIRHQLWRSARASLWREGCEDIPAGESYDQVRDTVMERYNGRMAVLRAG